MHKKSEVLSKLKVLKPILSKEWVELLGLFGSVARDEASQESDVDILIETTTEFLQSHKGFGYFAKLDEIRALLEKELQAPVDIVDKRGLLQHDNLHIIKSAIYV